MIWRMARPWLWEMPSRAPFCKRGFGRSGLTQRKCGGWRGVHLHCSSHSV